MQTSPISKRRSRTFAVIKPYVFIRQKDFFSQHGSHKSNTNFVRKNYVYLCEFYYFPLKSYADMALLHQGCKV